MSDRRYSEQEVSEIFKRATVVRAEGTAGLTHPDGMTLAQLEAVAKEAGIEPERVASAARELDQPQHVARTAMRVPVSVARSVELPRKLSDAEWEFLVTRLRESFDAVGKLETHGTLKQWSNGNLRAMLEPGINGHRVRFVSLNAGMRFRLLGGGFATIAGVASALLATVVPEQAGTALGVYGWTMALVGGLVLSSAVQTVKAWRQTRRNQFDALAAELERLTQR